jgi:hypothetical protein
MSHLQLNKFNKLLPIGISTLANMLKGGYVYVDKTYHIARMMATGGKYFFLSRPRRFGKSLFIDTLKQVFLGRKDLFKGLYIESTWDWSKKYPVIHFDFGIGMLQSRIELDAKIHQMIDEYYLEYEIPNKHDDISGRFNYLLTQLAKKYDQVVVLVDEYDKPILDSITETKTAVEMCEGLKNFYSVMKGNDQNLKFVMLTGVSKFSKVSLFSGLNNLADISIDPYYGDICGYKQEELEREFDEYLIDGNVDKEKLKLWYNGYNFGGSEEQKVYNPFDILLFCSKNYEYRNYWFETATPTFLIKLIEKNHYFTPNFEKIIALESILTSFDVDNIDIVTLLFQTGYLTITEITTIGDQFAYKLSYPNHEVKTSLNNSIVAYLGKSVNKNESYANLYYALVKNDFAELQAVFTSHFAGIPHQWYANNDIVNYEGFYASVIYSYFAALGYNLIAEDVTNRGRIDLTIIMPEKIIILEFKLAKYGNAQEAIAQIKTKKYAEKYRSKRLPIYLLAIIFDSDNRNVCEVVSEELIV